MDGQLLDEAKQGGERFPVGNRDHPRDFRDKIRGEEDVEEVGAAEFVPVPTNGICQRRILGRELREDPIIRRIDCHTATRTKLLIRSL